MESRSRSSGSRPKKKRGFFKKGHQFYAPPHKVRLVSSGEGSSQDPPETPISNPAPPKPSSSRSKMKLLNLYNMHSSDESDCEADTDSTTRSTIESDDKFHGRGYRLIDLDILNNQIGRDLVCRHCHSSSRLIEVKRSGLGSTLKFQCENKRCTESQDFFSDPGIKVTGSGLVNHSVNRRMALAMRFIGCGLSATRTFCGMMNLPPPVSKSSYDLIKVSMNQAVSDVQADSMKKAADIEYALAEKKGMYFFFKT